MADSQAAFVNGLFDNLLGSSNRDGLDPSLYAFQKTIRENDLFRNLATPILGARFDTRTWDPGTTFGVTFGQSLLGGLLGEMGRQREAQQINAVNQVLPQLYSTPESIDIPEGVDPEAFSILKANAIRENRIRDLKQQDYIRQLFGEIQKAQISKQLDIAAAGPLAAAQERGKLEGMGASGIPPEQNPETPQGKRANTLRDLENTFFQRIVGLPQYKLYSDMEGNFNSLIDLAKQDSKAADIGLLSTIARIRDPNSVVRDTEYKINQDTQAYLDSVVGNWRGIIGGESRLTPKDKAKIIASVVPKFNETGRSYLNSRNLLLDALRAQGGNPDNIPTLDFSPFDTSTLDTLFQPKVSEVPASLPSLGSLFEGKKVIGVRKVR